MWRRYSSLWPARQRIPKMEREICLPVNQRFVQALEVFRLMTERARLSPLSVHGVDDLVQDNAQLAKLGECRHIVAG